MVKRRAFLTICGAAVAGAAIPGKEAKAAETTVLIDDVDVSRYVKLGAYIGDTRPTVPEYTYTQQPGLRAFYEYLELLDNLDLVPGYGVYYDKLTFRKTNPGNKLMVQGRTNIPLEKVNAMWEEAMQRAWLPSGTVCNPHTGTRVEDFITCTSTEKETQELLDTFFAAGPVGGRVMVLEGVQVKPLNRKKIKWLKV